MPWPLFDGGISGAGQHRLAGAHPVAVPLHGVDLAVVRDVPVRVRPRPGRERVGGEPGVHERQARRVALVGQVGEERLNLRRGQHALVHQRPRRQAGEVDAGLVFGALAQTEGHPLQPHAGLARDPGDEQLGQPGQHLAGALPAGGGVDGHLAPAEDGQPLVGGEAGDLGEDTGPFRIFDWQESQADRVAASFGEREAGDCAEESVRDLREDARAVAGVRVSARRAAVLEVAQDPQGAGHHVVAAFGREVRDETHTTGVMFEPAVV